MNNFIRDLREQFDQQKTTKDAIVENANNKKADDLVIKLNPNDIYLITGIILDRIEDIIRTDVGYMIENDLRDQLLGYVFALSRFLDRKMVIQQLKSVFNEKKEPMPQFFEKLFEQERTQNISNIIE